MSRVIGKKPVMRFFREEGFRFRTSLNDKIYYIMYKLSFFRKINQIYSQTSYLLYIQRMR
jgi:hypothetical protein